MAQRVNRGVQKVAKQREQEDAQEFLTFLLDSTHQELLKLREMYGTQGELLCCSPQTLDLLLGRVCISHPVTYTSNENDEIPFVPAKANIWQAMLTPSLQTPSAM